MCMCVRCREGHGESLYLRDCRCVGREVGEDEGGSLVRFSRGVVERPKGVKASGGVMCGDTFFLRA